MIREEDAPSVDDAIEQGYFDIDITSRGLTGLFMFAFTIGLVYGIDKTGYAGRYCFPTLADAKAAIKDWNGEGDPSGNWIKHKGGIGEYSNPSLPKEPWDE